MENKETAALQSKFTHRAVYNILVRHCSQSWAAQMFCAFALHISKEKTEKERDRQRDGMRAIERGREFLCCLLWCCLLLLSLLSRVLLAFGWFGLGWGNCCCFCWPMRFSWRNYKINMNSEKQWSETAPVGIGALCIIIGDCNEKSLPFISHAHTVTSTNGTNLLNTHTQARTHSRTHTLHADGRRLWRKGEGRTFLV